MGARGWFRPHPTLPRKRTERLMKPTFALAVLVVFSCGASAQSLLFDTAGQQQVYATESKSNARYASPRSRHPATKPNQTYSDNYGNRSLTPYPGNEGRATPRN